MNQILSRISPMFAILLVSILSACNLITIERIADPIGETPDSFSIDATLQSIATRMDQQDNLVEAMATQVSSLSTQAAIQATHVSYLATRGPIGSTSILDPSPTPYEKIVGAVEIEDGACCVGGIAGEEIEIKIQFTANGFEAPVTEMRYAFGGFVDIEDGLEELSWEPFTEEISIKHLVFINWVGFYVRVQYKDSLGNLSQIYIDDISVEGMPGITPTPRR